MSKGPGHGAKGGAANEAGGGFRAGLAAYVAAHILRGMPLYGLAMLPEAAIPRSFVLEADSAVDDLDVTLERGTALIQAKRRLDATAVKQAAMQWVALGKDGEFDPERTRLVVAGAEPSGPVKLLRRALERNRRSEAGGYTKGERDALEKLRDHLKELDEEVRERLLEAAVVWPLDLHESNGVAENLGQALMEPGVVAVGKGKSAWRLLRDEVRELAARRFGVDLGDLMELLADEDLPLTEDAKGYAAARLREREAKLAAYRERVRRRGEYLDLGALGAPLAPVSLAEIDASVTVQTIPDATDGEGEGRAGRLPWALRRRGRALLLGVPGSGKSVALEAAAAHYAARPGWPLPIVASLKRVAPRLASQGFGAALLEVAFENEPIEDQVALRAAAVDLMRCGDAAIFLDALDEARSASPAIIAGLREELGYSDPALEVLLSTRDVTYADAHVLAFPELRLTDPDRPWRTVKAILGLVAEQRRLDGQQGRAWVKVRQEWVEDRLGTDPALRETPLMIVLLTLAAAEHGAAENRPTGRAAVLQRVIDDVVMRWETGQRIAGEAPRLGGLQGGEAVKAARESFVTIGDRVFKEGEVVAEELAEPVAAMMRGRFGLAPAPAEVAAEEALALWDEAGVFIAEGAARRVRTRIQLFAELACALAIAGASGEVREAWARERLAEEGESQPLLLAAGLREDVTATIVDWLLADPHDPHRADVLETAIEQGALLDEAAAERLAEGLLEIGVGDDEASWARARLLVALDLSPEQEAAALACFEALDPPRAMLARAMAAEGWPREGAEAEADLRALLEADPALFKWTTGFFAALPDRSYQETVVRAAARILDKGERNLAELLAERMGKSFSIRMANRLRDVLNDAGFASVLADSRKRERQELRSLRSMGQTFREVEETDLLLVKLVAEFAEPAENLDRSSSRRLDDLVALIRATGFNEALAGEAEHGVARDPTSLAAAMRVVAERAGLDLAKLAAEAAAWIELRTTEEEVDPFGPMFMLNDGGRPLELGTWDQVAEPATAAVELAEAIASPYQWIARIAARGLAEVEPPAVRDGALVKLEEILPEAKASSQRMVALMIGLISPDDTLDRFTGDARPMIRRSAAALARGGGPQAEAALRLLLVDPDGGVRMEAAEAVKSLGLEDEFDLEMAAGEAMDAEGWECPVCGHENGPEKGRCGNCEKGAQLLGVPPPEPIVLDLAEDD
jgi:hypothetical protein